MRYDFLIDNMTWSYSRLTAFETCPYEWLLKYIFGENGDGGFFANYGSFMHEILQKYLAKELTRRQLPAYYLAHFSEAVPGEAPSLNTYKKYFADGLRYLRNIQFPHTNIIGVEQRVEFRFAGHSFVGFIDCVSDDNGLAITDHKSRTLKPYSGRTVPTKSDRDLDDYLRQLYIYAEAIKQTYGTYPKRLEFNCFRNQEFISLPFDKGRLMEVEYWAASTIERIRAEDAWLANPHYWKCKHLCDCCGECVFSGAGD